MAAPETTNNVTVRKLTSLMSQLWTKIKNALDGKQDNLGISSSGDAGKFLNEQGNWETPAGTEQVNADWDATSGKAEILHKPQNLVEDASYVHTDNNYTTADKAKVASAVQPEDLGTAASKDVPTSGNASTTQVVMGSDSRLTDARSASDVSAWAKAATKPTYTASEVGAVPTSRTVNGLALSRDIRFMYSALSQISSSLSVSSTPQQVIEAMDNNTIASLSMQGGTQFTDYKWGPVRGTSGTLNIVKYSNYRVWIEYNYSDGNYFLGTYNTPNIYWSRIPLCSRVPNPTAAWSDSAIGSATRPVYVNESGIIVACDVFYA